jgi:hypothetical protein
VTDRSLYANFVRRGGGKAWPSEQPSFALTSHECNLQVEIAVICAKIVSDCFDSKNFVQSPQTRQLNCNKQQAKMPKHQMDTRFRSLQPKKRRSIFP